MADKKPMRSSIGGQAVLEGVMMRGVCSSATAVRAPDGSITVESSRFKSVKEKSFIYRVPIIRGVINFALSMYLGVGTIMRSAEVMGDVVEPSKFENWLAKKTKIDLMQAAMFIAVILGIALAVGLFIVLPEVLVGLLFRIPAVDAGVGVLARNLITGAIRITIFILYIVACTSVGDIKRLFMYHGAEHKTISCYEACEDLTVENVQKHTTVHNRCGTTFLFLVMIIGILVNSALFFLPGYEKVIFKILYKILFLPLVAGISYEVLKLLAKSDNILFRIIRAPGLWLQKLTTKQPDDDMVEVAITAFKTVMALDADPSLPTQSFVITKPAADLKKELEEKLPAAEFEASDIDWIMCEVTGVSRGELAGLKTVSQEAYDRALQLAEQRATHKPLQYVLGYAEFYGNRIKVDENVLIPRPETELLAEQVIIIADGKSVLDLCTGSGAIAIAVAKAAKAKSVTAADVSEKALAVATENAASCGVEVETVLSNMFDGFADRKFDIIVSNPPYIPTADIDGLDTEVKAYEPKLALDGGADGLDFYRIIADGLDAHLAADGVLLLELGIGQYDGVAALFKSYGVSCVNDYDGIARILIAKKEI